MDSAYPFYGRLSLPMSVLPVPVMLAVSGPRSSPDLHVLNCTARFVAAAKCGHRALRIASAIVAMSFATSAGALEVSGLIEVDTIWHQVDSPITVTADVTISSGALLTIEPGVEVRFAADTRFTVADGSLVAIGTSSSPIVFTPDTAGGVLPGFWGPVRFTTGTNDGATILDNVAIRYGRGLIIDEASPTLNRVSFEQNYGAAISLDLQSSPVGVGLQASGNGLNGISIPGGTITGATRWGLVGIPYVVQGVVTIGLPPIALTPTTMSLTETQHGQFVVTLLKPAPAGGMDLDVVSSVPGVATAPTTLHVVPGSLQATFEISALAAGETTISVSRLELGAVSAAVSVLPRFTISIVPDTAVVPLGRTREFFVRLSPEAPAGGAFIQLSSSNTSAVTVPSQVYVYQFTQYAIFEANGAGLGTSVLTAAAEPHIAGSAQIEVRTAFLSFGNIGVLAPGASRNVTINLSAPAPPEALLVELSSSSPGVVDLPVSVFAPPGATSTTFLLRGLTQGTTNLSATANNYDSAHVSVAVDLITLSFDPAGPVQIPVGTSDQFVIRSNRPAPAGGLSIGISASPGGGVGISPTTVTIAEGATMGDSPVTITGGIPNSDVVVTANSTGIAGANLDVRVVSPPELKFEGFDAVLGKGLRSEIMLTRTREGGIPDNDSDPLTVTLVSSDPAKLSVPSVVRILGGQSSVAVPFSAIEVAESIEVVATAPGYIQQDPFPVQVREPQIIFEELDHDRAVGVGRDEFAFHIYGGYGGTPGVAMTNIVVALNIAAADPAGIVGGLFASSSGSQSLTELIIRTGRNVPTDSMGAPATAFVGAPNATGTYQVSATIPGQTAQLSEVQTVYEGPLKIELTSNFPFPISHEVVGKGFALDQVYVTRFQQGQPFAGDLPLTVSFTVSDAGKLEVPLSVVIPAGASKAPLRIAGLETTGEPVGVAATAPGYAPPAENLAVDVVQPQIDYFGPPGQSFLTSQVVGDPRNMFILQWYGPGGSAIDRTISVSLVDQNPADVANGFFAESSGLEPIGTLVLPAGASGLGNLRFFYIGSPRKAGSYKLSVVVPGMGTWLSPNVVVTESAQSITFGATPFVGRGLRTAWARVQRNGFSTEDPLSISVVSSDPSKVTVPSIVTIPAGESEVDVPVSGMELTAVPVTITASVTGQPTLSSAIDISVVEPSVEVVGLRELRGVGGERNAVHVRWSVPGTFDEPQIGQAATTVAVSLIDRTPAGVVSALYAAASGPEQRDLLVIPAEASGSDSAGAVNGFIYVGSPNSTGIYRLRAVLAGLAQWESPEQTVVVPTLNFLDSTEHVVGNGMRSDSIMVYRAVGPYFDFEAPASALVITPSCEASSICSVPSTITIAAGEISQALPITGTALGGTRVTVSALGYSTEAHGDIPVSVVKPELSLVNVPEFMTAGGTDLFQVQVQVPASNDQNQTAASAISLSLTSAVPSVAMVTSTVAIPSGAVISGVAELSAIAAGFTTITASGVNLQPVTSQTIAVSE